MLFGPIRGDNSDLLSALLLLLSGLAAVVVVTVLHESLHETDPSLVLLAFAPAFSYAMEALGAVSRVVSGLRLAAAGRLSKS